MVGSFYEVLTMHGNLGTEGEARKMLGLQPPLAPSLPTPSFFSLSFVCLSMCYFFNSILFTLIFLLTIYINIDTELTNQNRIV